MDTLYTFWDNITHYKTESVLGLMNSATKVMIVITVIIVIEFKPIDLQPDPQPSTLPRGVHTKLWTLSFHVRYLQYRRLRTIEKGTSRRVQV